MVSHQQDTRVSDILDQLRAQGAHIVADGALGRSRGAEGVSVLAHIFARAQVFQCDARTLARLEAGQDTATTVFTENTRVIHQAGKYRARSTFFALRLALQADAPDQRTCCRHGQLFIVSEYNISSVTPCSEFCEDGLYPACSPHPSSIRSLCSIWSSPSCPD